MQNPRHTTRNLGSPFLILLFIIALLVVCWQCGGIDYALNAYRTGYTGATLRGMGMLP